MTTVGRSAFMSAHARDHLLDVGDRRFRLDAVAEIEDQSALAVARQYIIYRAIECRAARDQRQRIEIALHRHLALHGLPDHRGVGSPVDADGIDAGRADIIRQLPGSAAGKADDLRVRYLLAYAFDNAPCRLD